jgi:hypothetical protein
MDISGYNLPEPCFGIGADELVSRWIDRERAQHAAGLGAAARMTRNMRREMQEALDLVADPAGRDQRPREEREKEYMDAIASLAERLYAEHLAPMSSYGRRQLVRALEQRLRKIDR